MAHVDYTIRVHDNGDREYLKDDLLHREDGPAYEWSDGTKFWYLNGKLHRDNGPAREYANGNKAWYLNGDLHREDGPAIELASGYKEWYLNGIYVTEKEHAEKTKPTKELTVGEIEQLLGYKIKITGEQ